MIFLLQTEFNTNPHNLYSQHRILYSTHKFFSSTFYILYYLITLTWKSLSSIIGSVKTWNYSIGYWNDDQGWTRTTDIVFAAFKIVLKLFICTSNTPEKYACHGWCAEAMILMCFKLSSGYALTFASSNTCALQNL